MLTYENVKELIREHGVDKANEIMKSLGAIGAGGQSGTKRQTVKEQGNILSVQVEAATEIEALATLGLDSETLKALGLIIEEKEDFDDGSDTKVLGKTLQIHRGPYTPKIKLARNGVCSLSGASVPKRGYAKDMLGTIQKTQDMLDAYSKALDVVKVWVRLKMEEQVKPA